MAYKNDSDSDQTNFFSTELPSPDTGYEYV